MTIEAYRTYLRRLCCCRFGDDEADDQIPLLDYPKPSAISTQPNMQTAMSFDGGRDTPLNPIDNDALQLSEDRTRSPRLEVNPGESILNLNNEVPVDGTTVACRHFAYAYYMADNKLDFLENVATHESITRHFTGQLGTLDQNFRAMVRNAGPERKHLILSEKFGVLLSNLIGGMTRQNARHVEALFLSQNHVFALAVGNYPEDAAAGRQFVINAYDPDATGKHKSGYFATRDAVASRPVEWFFPQGVGVGENYLTAIFDFDLAREDGESYGLANGQNSSQAEILCMALRTGLPDVVRDLLALPIEEDEVIRLKVARALTLSGDPALFYALKDGHFAALAPYSEFLQRLSLRREYLMAVLEAKTTEGVPALIHAISYATEEAGSAAATPNEIVEAYTSFLRGLGLNQHELTRLAWSHSEGVTLRDLHKSAFDLFVQRTGITGNPPR